MEAINSVSIVSFENQFKSAENVCEKEEKSNKTYVNSLFNWKAVSFDDLPLWMRDNEFLWSFYRPQLPSYEVCFWSIFRVHNQTANIWTHLVPAMLFNFVFVNHFPQHVISEDQFIFNLVYFGLILCFYGSALFHTFMCHSERTASIVAKIDYCGVSIHTFTNLIGLSYFAFYCHPFQMKSFHTLATILCLFCLYLNTTSAFNQSTSFCRIFRSIVFFTFGFISIVPQIYWFFANDMQITESIESMILMDICYVSGALVYASRFPERYFVGKCDLFPSHMWFHILIVGGSYFCYKAIEEMAKHSAKHCFL